MHRLAVGGRTNLRGAAHLYPSERLARDLVAAAPRLASLRLLDFTCDDDVSGLHHLTAALPAVRARLETLIIRSARLFNTSRSGGRPQPQRSPTPSAFQPS